MKAIEISNFSKFYKTCKAVDDISFDVELGEVFGFIGQNGAGKSTTIRAILNMIYPTSGSIKVLGLDCVKNTKEIKRQVAYIPSEVSYYSNMRVIDLFKYAANFCGYKDFAYINDLCDYFDLDTTRPIRHLSLGNRKKVCVIQALIKQPKIIILDEPTSGLDPLMQDKLFNVLLREKEKGVCIFLSSHNLADVEKYCERVAVIKEGKIMEVSSITEFTKQTTKNVTVTLSDGKVEQFVWNKDIKALLEKLNTMDIINLDINHISVQDEFMKYYEETK